LVEEDARPGNACATPTATGGVEVIGIGIDSAAKIAGLRDSHRLTLPCLSRGAGGSD